MASIIGKIAEELLPGYTLLPQGGRFVVIDPEGEIARHQVTGQPIIINDAGSYHYIRRAVQNLREAGVAKPLRIKERKHEVRKPAQVSEKSPLVLAREILRDPQSTGRERAMARAYMTAADSNQRIAKLARHLGQRLKELEARLDDTI